MKVLVTGASGLIGTALCDALLARGDEVVGLSRSPERARMTNPTVTWHAWQATSERPPAAAFDGVTHVVNLVGAPINQRWTDEAKERILASRETATRNLVHTIQSLDAPPKVFIGGSAVGYYGDRGDAILDESSGPGDSFDAQVCVAWEKATAEADDGKTRVAIVRTGLVLDKSEGLLKELLLPFKLGVGGPVAGGDQYMPWVHIDDEVRLLLWALRTESVTGVINGMAPEPVTNKVFSKALGKALGRPAVMPIPKLALKLRLGKELGEVASGGQRAVPRRATDLGFEFKFPDIDSALQDAVK